MDEFGDDFGQDGGNPFGTDAPAQEGANNDDMFGSQAEASEPQASGQPEPEGSQAIDPAMFGGPSDLNEPLRGGPGLSTPAAPTTGADGKEVPDARVAWRAQNAKMLQEKEEKEKKANSEAKSKAAEWLKKFYADRSARINKAQEDNAAQEQAATKGPVGDTDWTKVMSMIDFSFKPPQEKEAERERFKALLFSAKEKNVPCVS